MTSPYRPQMTRGQRLAAEAAEATEVREWQDHPDVVALRVEKWRGIVNRVIWVGMVLGMLFTMTNVQQFAARGATMNDPVWWVSWMIDPAVCLILLGILLTEKITSPEQIRTADRTRAFKWALLAATYTMNTWQSWADHSASGVVLHSVPVLVVLAGAEVVTDCQEKLTEAILAVFTRAQDRKERKAREAAEKKAAEDAQKAAEDRERRLKEAEDEVATTKLIDRIRGRSPQVGAVEPAVRPAAATGFTPAVATGSTAAATGSTTAVAPAVATAPRAAAAPAAETGSQPRSTTAKKVGRSPAGAAGNKADNSRGRNDRGFEWGDLIHHARKIIASQPELGTRALAAELSTVMRVDVPRYWAQKAKDEIGKPIHAVKAAAGAGG